MAICDVCYRHCDLSEGERGMCLVRQCVAGSVVPIRYSQISGFQLDPIEKKPLRHFYPGSKILSVGSFGCNLYCPFCQNHYISRKPGSGFDDIIPPDMLADYAVRFKDKGNIGIAYTYNEPLVAYEYVRDSAKLVREKGMKNVLVTNGTVELPILEQVLPYIDAMNIDLKSMDAKVYREFLHGDLKMVMNFIERSVTDCHVELTSLIVPGMNDSEEEMRELSGWISGLRDKSGNIIGDKIPLHVSRFFPKYQMSDKEPTDVELVYHLADIAREKLQYVYTGNC